jgi:hypothetical protein
MPPEQPATPTVTQPVTDLTDPRAITLLTTEHWSLLTARSLAYNEAFTRGGMFLTFLSMSFVALALFSSAMSFGDAFLTVAAVVLAFDVVLGLATYVRIAGANVDDLRALHGMARIRHGYTQIAPIVEPYFTTATHDDVDSVITAYGTLPSSSAGTVLYGLTTSGGMIGLITSMVGGVFAAVLGLLIGAPDELTLWIGIGGGLLVFLALVLFTTGAVTRNSNNFSARFPAAAKAEEPATDR